MCIYYNYVFAGAGLGSGPAFTLIIFIRVPWSWSFWWVSTVWVLYPITLHCTNVSWDLVCAGHLAFFICLVLPLSQILLHFPWFMFVILIDYSYVAFKCAKSSAFSLLLIIFRLTSFFSSTLWGSWWLNWGPPPPPRPSSTGEADYSALTDPRAMFLC